MCRRRIIAIILSLALVTSCFVISVSADEEEYNQVFIKVNNNYYLLEENVGIASASLNSDSSYTFTIQAIHPRSGSLNNNQSLAVNFTIRVYVIYYSSDFDHSISYLNPMPSNYNSYVNTANGLMLIQSFRDYTPSFQPDQDNIGYYGFQASFLFTSTNAVNVNLTSTWTNNSLARMVVHFVIEDLDIHPSFNWFVSSILNPALVTMNAHLSALHTAVDSMNQAFVLDDNYSYNTIYYDEDGNAHVQEVADVSWVESIQGMLFAMSQPVVHQVQQEQMARDAGFEDVLDDAYDRSSPGDFLDFLSIGDIATWNEGAYEDAQGDAITYWFSQSCKDNIDSVPVVRGEEPQIIDFYSSHISEYWEALGIDTADSSGD